MNIIDYKCVYGASSLEFSSKVAGHISKGWQPFGGVCVSSCYDSSDDVERLMYAQAMVKYEHQPARFVAQPDTYIEKTG